MVSHRTTDTVPVHPDSWKELAKHGHRLSEAARAYCAVNPDVKLVEGMRHAREFYRQYSTTRH